MIFDLKLLSDDKFCLPPLYWGINPIALCIQRVSLLRSAGVGGIGYGTLSRRGKSVKTIIAKALPIVLFSCLVMPAHADWMPAFKVAKLVAHDTGHVFVYTGPALPGGFAGCSNVGYLQVSSANPSFKNIYAALLTALTSQGAVVGWVSGCNSPVYEGPLLTRVDISRP